MTRQPSDGLPLPSAFEVLGELRAVGPARRPVVFLDYDGTLTPIVQRPDLAVLAPEVRATLRRLVAVTQLAVVSGRDLEDVRAHIDLEGATVAGSHGLEARFADGRRETFGAAESFLEVLEEAADELGRRIGGIAGARIERKRFTLAAHYREVAADQHAAIVAAAAEFAAEHPSLRLGHGKMVVELRPNTDWHKGRFVAAFLDRLPEGRSRPVVYLGDDLTDEDAFEALRNLTPPGTGIFVGADEGRATAARFALADVAAVHEWLAALARELGA